ncbi:hypothetical protein ASA1KI_39640 [Opitutales bacterium ASA1]|uniref:hypothetical protein n=1 Tax=Congregicoccus parvus TaxID=3081749 RepID=UPI002B2A7151|nr:hypothetical protein ASA1KI_39640 [Opitutales bacterium ASA1]
MAQSKVSVLLDFRSRLAGITAAITGLASLAGTYVSLRGTIAGSRDVIGLGAALLHVSQSSGLTVSKLMVLRQALQDAGGEANQASQLVAKMQKSIVDAGRGAGEARPWIASLGIDLAQLAALDPAAQLETLSAALRRIEDPAQRTAASMAFFGEAGAKLGAFFQTEGFADVESSLGRLPAIMERSAVEFERIDTLLGRLLTKGRQVFAGFTDQISTHIREPLEAVDKIDFSGVGQKLGALAGVAIEAWKQGQFAEFVATSIEAAGDAGAMAFKASLRAAIDFLAQGSTWVNLVDFLGTVAAGFSKAINGVALAVVPYIGAAAAKLADEVHVMFKRLDGLARQALAPMLNWLAEHVERTLNALIAGLNKLPGVNIDSVALGRVDARTEPVRQAITWEKALAIAKAEGMRLDERLNDLVNARLDTLRKIVRGEQDATAETGARVSALEELNRLMAEYEAKLAAARAAASTPPPPGGGGGGGTGNTGGGGGTGAATFGKQMETFFNNLPALADVAAREIGNIYAGTINTLAGGIEGLINRTLTLGQALRSIAAGIGQTVLQGFSRVVAEMTAKFVFVQGRYAALKAANFLVDQVYAAKGLALTLASAAKSLLAWIPSAIAASISSYGIAAVVGVGAALAAIAATGFERGGYTGDGASNAIAGAVHRGEYVFSAPAVQRLGVANLDAMHASAKRGYSAGGYVTDSGSGATAAGENPINVSVAIVQSRDAGLAWLKDRPGRKVLYDQLARDRRDMGMQT